MISYPRLNEISYRIEGYSGSDSNYRIIKAELFQEGTEQWSVVIQREEDDGKDFMQDIMRKVNGYQEKIHFRVISASVNKKGDILRLAFVVEDSSEEKNEDGRKE